MDELMSKRERDIERDVDRAVNREIIAEQMGQLPEGVELVVFGDGKVRHVKSEEGTGFGPRGVGRITWCNMFWARNVMRAAGVRDDDKRICGGCLRSLPAIKERNRRESRGEKSNG